MPKQLLTVKSYPALLSSLKKVFVEGLQKIEEEKVKTYWRTGQLISDYILVNIERADYGDYLYNRISQDLGIDVSTLQRTVQFYRAFPISAAQRKLTWMHYIQLITVRDEKRRQLLAERAAKKEWGYRELAEAIRLDRLSIEDKQEKSAQPIAAPTRLSVCRLRLFTYRILEPNYLTAQEGQNVVDLGFSNNIQAEIFGVAKLKAQEIIQTSKNGNTFSFRRSDAKPKELYTYVAQVERVVDGDTLWLNIDCGFRVWTRQKVRLRGIDAPELSTKKGVGVKEFVEAKLKEVAFVIVKTYKSDKYDRYLTDVFYPPPELRRAGLANETEPDKVLEEGIFLNQQLLDEGLAEAWNP